MKTAEIKEYRKLSAKELGLELIDGRVVIRNKSGKEMKNAYNAKGMWEPDQDANQMLMVWKWLNKRIDLTIEWLPLSEKWNISLYAKHGSYAFPDGTDADIKLATMKAFIRYNNSPQ